MFEILIITPPDGEAESYFEGHSPMVDVIDNTPGAGGWFSFEEDWAKGCADLNLHLGFTVEQILAAPRH